MNAVPCSENSFRCSMFASRTTRTTPRNTRITSRTIRTIHIRSPPRGAAYTGGSDGPGCDSGVAGGGSGGPGGGSGVGDGAYKVLGGLLAVSRNSE